MDITFDFDRNDLNGPVSFGGSGKEIGTMAGEVIGGGIGEVIGSVPGAAALGAFGGFVGGQIGELIDDATMPE